MSFWQQRSANKLNKSLMEKERSERYMAELNKLQQEVEAELRAQMAKHEMEMAGKKFDAGKVDPSFLFEYFPRALLAMASVCGYGARKYIRGGWRTVPEGIQRYTAAHDRHRFLEHTEGPYDDGDSGLAHAVQVLWNAAARVEFMLETGAIEDRTGNDIGPDGKPILGTSKKR